MSVLLCLGGPGSEVSPELPRFPTWIERMIRVLLVGC